MVDRHWLLSLTSSTQCTVLDSSLLTRCIQRSEVLPGASPSCPVVDIVAPVTVVYILASFGDDQTTGVTQTHKHNTHAHAHTHIHTHTRTHREREGEREAPRSLYASAFILSSVDGMASTLTADCPPPHICNLTAQ